MDETTKTLTSVIKRNGKEEVFNPGKITSAIGKAGRLPASLGMKWLQKLTVRVVNLIHQLVKDQPHSVEEIQDIVEEVLLTSPTARVPRPISSYREQHAQIREIANKFNTDLVTRYLNKEDWRVNENSNMAFSLQGLNHYISAEVSKGYWLGKVYPREIKEAHSRGDLHIHDLGLVSVYCVGGISGLVVGRV